MGLKFPIHVCVVGPDGAGKTTLANSLVVELRSNGLTTRRLRPRPTWFHAFSPSAFNYQQPHATAPLSAARSRRKVLLKLPYFLLRRVSLLRIDVDVLVEERGWVDQAVDPKRYGLHQSTIGTVLAVASAAGRPHLTILLGGDSTKIANRKNELPTAEIKRQLEQWQHLSTSHSIRHFEEISTTTGTVEQTTRQLLEIVHAIERP